MATSNADSEKATSRPSIWLRCLFWVYDYFFTGGPYKLVRNWMALAIGLLIILSELAPDVFKTIVLVLVLLPLVLAALIVKVVPLIASAVGWGERLGIVTTDERISLTAQAVRLLSGGEDAIEYLIDLFRK